MKGMSPICVCIPGYTGQYCQIGMDVFLCVYVCLFVYACALMSLCALRMSLCVCVHVHTLYLCKEDLAESECVCIIHTHSDSAISSLNLMRRCSADR